MELENSDVAAERAVLGGIFQHGSDAFIDVSDIIGPNTMTIDIHNVFYRCFSHILKDTTDVKLDLASVYSAASSLGLTSIIEKPEERKLLRGIMNFKIELANVRKMAAKIRKLEIARMLRQQLSKAGKTLSDISGEEPLSQILGIAENSIFDFTSLINESQSEGPQLISTGLDEYIKYLANNPAETVGVSTGMPYYDRAIGGGIRMKTVNVVGARPKAGKTMMADNVALHIAGKLKIPVINLDTEMSKEDHWHRMIANLSGVIIDDIETGKFAKEIKKKKAVIEAIAKLKDMPYHYLSIAGQSFEDTISNLRRWRKKVGNGHAVVIYDYLKLMSSEGISKDLKEYQLLGFQMTALHNFMVKYDTGSLAFIQLNRDGIEKEDTSVASGSDRIIWLCSNFSVYKKLTALELSEHIAAGIPKEKGGNRKLIPIVSRHGAGLEEDDYICLQSHYHLGRITELGTRKSLENTGNRNDGQIIDGDESGNPQF